MPKSRLLMLTHRFPFPPNRGDRIRSYHILRWLSQRFEVSLASFVDEPLAADHLQHIQGICRDVVTVAPLKSKRWLGATGAILTGKSITEGMFWSRPFAQQVRSLHQQRDFGHVYVFCSSMFPYVEDTIFERANLLVDLVDVDSLKWKRLAITENPFKRWIFGREARNVGQLESRILDRADRVILVSQQEALEFERQCLQNGQVSPRRLGKIDSVSNGVDTDYFAPAEQNRKQKSTDRPLRLTFTGVLNYEPNVAGLTWFCDQVLPNLQSQVPTELSIVGRSPNRRVWQLANRSGVEVIGPVPDVRPFTQQADVSIAPLQLARGIQNKVLEAMSMGRPVVCSSQAATGIEAADGLNLLVADQPEQWIDALVKLYRSESLRQKLGRNARQLVQNAYSWDARLQKFNHLLRPQTQPEAALV